MEVNNSDKCAISALAEFDSRNLAERLFEAEKEKHRLELLLDKANDTVIELRQEIAAATAVLGVAVGNIGDLIDRCNRVRARLKDGEVPF